MNADTIAAAATIAGLLGAAYATWRRFRPSVRRASSAVDALVGREAVTDRSGQIIEAAQPGLVHRVATVEEAVVEIRHVVALWTETQKRLDQHDGRIRQLEDSRLERLVTQAESAHMWRAVADAAAPDTTDEA